MALAHAHARVAELLRSPAAGAYASDVHVLRETNNVGGAHINMELPLALQKRVFNVTQKDFTGNARQLSLGSERGYEADATALFFAPGSIQIIGARSDDMICAIIHRICEILRAIGHAPYILYLSIDNKVVKGNVGFAIKLECIHQSLPGFATSYVPQSFPGLICVYQDVERVVTITMFESGRIMALGIQNMQEISEIYLRVISMVTQHRAPAQPLGARPRSRVRTTGAETEVRVTTKKIGLAIQAHLAANPGDMSSASLQQTIDRVVARVLAEAAASRGTKRTLVAAY